MTERGDILRKAFALAEEQAEEQLDLMVGKWGARWVLEKMAGIFDQIAAETDCYEECNNHANAQMRGEILRVMGHLFK